MAVYCLAKRSYGGLAWGAAGTALIYWGLTGRCQIFEALGIDHSRRRREIPGGSQKAEIADHGFHVERSILINRSPEKLYSYWRNFENLPRFMEHLDSVRVNPRTNVSHWKVRGPIPMEWDARTINEKENELIAWESLQGSDVAHAGSVRFRRAPGGGGTEVKVTLKYNPPAGKVGRSVARLLGEDPEAAIEEDLRRFKQIMEAGEVATTEGQSTCT